MFSEPSKSGYHLQPGDPSRAPQLTSPFRTKAWERSLWPLNRPRVRPAIASSSLSSPNLLTSPHGLPMPPSLTLLRIRLGELSLPVVEAFPPNGVSWSASNETEL